MEQKFKYAEALAIAQEIVQLLQPHCARIQIAGSIRRERPEVKDIEIVAIPLPYQTGLFQDGIAEVVNQWPKVKGELEYGKCKYTQRILPQGIKLDLFFANETNWGLILAIRTGSADFSHKVLASTWSKLGYTSQNGQLTQPGRVFEVREEKDLFYRLGIPYVEPQNREL